MPHKVCVCTMYVPNFYAFYVTIGQRQFSSLYNNSLSPLNHSRASHLTIKKCLRGPFFAARHEILSTNFAPGFNSLCLHYTVVA